MLSVRDWSTLAAPDFAGLDPERTIAVLPIAAIEQHGAHLPTGTDAIINHGLWKAARGEIGEDVDVLVLPQQSIGKSDEHIASKGTLHVPAEVLIPFLTAIGLSVARAGIRKLLILNSHGGNSEVMGIVARSLRVQAGMFVVATSWARMGHPDGHFGEDELRFGIHGGAVETALMLHLAPDEVRMDLAAPTEPRSVALARENAVLEGAGRNGFAWIAQDLHPSGIAGDPTAATAEAGQALADHAARRVATLLSEMARFSLASLHDLEG